MPRTCARFASQLKYTNRSMNAFHQCRRPVPVHRRPEHDRIAARDLRIDLPHVVVLAAHPPPPARVAPIALANRQIPQPQNLRLRPRGLRPLRNPRHQNIRIPTPPRTPNHRKHLHSVDLDIRTPTDAILLIVPFPSIPGTGPSRLKLALFGAAGFVCSDAVRRFPECPYGHTTNPQAQIGFVSHGTSSPGRGPASEIGFVSRSAFSTAS